MENSAVSARELIELRDAMQKKSEGGESIKLPPIPRGAGDIKLDRSFISRIYDSYLDVTLAVIAQKRSDIDQWPASITVSLQMSGDSGSYREDDTYQAWASLRIQRREASRYYLTLSDARAYRAALINIIERVSKMAALVE